jgi:hypothetical protein
VTEHCVTSNATRKKSPPKHHRQIAFLTWDAFKQFYRALLVLSMGVSMTLPLTYAETQNEFLVRAYGGALVRDGGKCLDYAVPPLVGSAVFLNDCSVAHPVVVEEINTNHDVVLRADTLVIGVSRGGRQPVAPPPERLLELQTRADKTGQVGDRASGAVNQIFALDGDSIILAADRNFVAKVQNARGTNGTPVVLGQRQLADHESWDFRGFDGTNRYPTSGFVPVRTIKDLKEHLPQATWGTVLDIKESFDIDNLELFNIPAGVTIRGNRRGTVFGPQLAAKNASPDGILFVIGSNDVRITGLRLRGPNPNRSTKEDQPASRAIVIRDELCQRSIVDHNDISDWTTAGVLVKQDIPGDDVDCDKAVLPNPATRPAPAHIARNFIHHNLKNGDGYGANANAGGFPFIEANTFSYNRHAIAGTNSIPKTGYRAWFNLVLSGVHRYNLHKTHDFDIHGTGDNCCGGGFGGIAGGYMDIYANTFLGKDHKNFKLRGKPCQYVEFHNNISYLAEGESAVYDIGFFHGTPDDKDDVLKVAEDPEQFEQPSVTKRLGVGDFDGDGVDDLLLTTGAAWYYSPAGKAEWRFLNNQTDRIGSLLFGDFDGDGRTDVFTQHGSDCFVSWGGISNWEKIASHSEPISEYRIGDFDGDRRSDIFIADGTEWRVSSGGTGPFARLALASERSGQLCLGDVDGDGKTDVLVPDNAGWTIFDSGTGQVQRIHRNDPMPYRVSLVTDVDGDGKADVIAYQGVHGPHMQAVRWAFVSGAQQGPWVTMASRKYLPNKALAMGRFRDSRRVDILEWSGNQLYVLSAIPNTSGRWSTQDMK